MRFKILEETHVKPEVAQAEIDVGLKFRLLSDDAAMMVVACDMRGIEYDRGNLIVLEKEGTIFRCCNINNTLGFQLDSLGRIKTASERARDLREMASGKDRTQTILDFVATLIDSVESTIRGRYPAIERIASRAEGNTLLHGEDYYTLEDGLIDDTKELLDELKKKSLS